MPECPRCRQPVKADAIACAYCGTALKAFGHPGITLYRAEGEESLCATCTYDKDDTCNFPQRPHASECTLYDNVDKPVQSAIAAQPRLMMRKWVERNLGWLVLLGIILVSLLLAVMR